MIIAKSTQRFLGLILLFGVFLASACKESTPTPLSEERSIVSFKFEQLSPPSNGKITDSTGMVQVTIPFNTDKSALVPTIELSEGATINPPSGTPQDFTDFVIYQVTAENGAIRTYTVLLSEGSSTDASLAKLILPDLLWEKNFNSSETIVAFDVPFGTDVSAVRLNLETEEPNSTVVPASGSVVDLTTPQLISVTAPDGISTREYILSLNIQPQETGIRGVWLTNVDSNVLNTQAGIQEAVDICAELNINTIFVVTLNKAETTYPSQVMQDLIGKRIGTAYEGRDPLRELIDAAHAKNIKVFAWFEYGFAAMNGSPGPILNAKPEWASLNSDGNQVVKNGFYWLNSLLPEVQNFMDDLVLEVVRNYPDIDGVQGDDRLPAMPTEGGYDDYTVDLYKSQHGGASPPTDRTNSAWVQWRAEILNTYAKNLYNKVKALNTNCLVAMSPSPMSFGLTEYLQDYGSWVNDGYCDIVSPQLYRRENQGFGVYRSLLTSQLNIIDTDKRNTFYPGVLSYLGSYFPSENYMARVIRENRERGVMGEVHFFYSVLLVRERAFKALYPGTAIFPNF